MQLKINYVVGDQSEGFCHLRKLKRSLHDPLRISMSEKSVKETFKQELL